MKYAGQVEEIASTQGVAQYGAFFGVERDFGSVETEFF
jgi:hypothetical protein